MDPFRLCLALGPLAVYLLLLSGINLSRRPLVVSGARDAATLGIALSGLVIVGPMELFFPSAAAARYGALVWLLLALLYALGLVLVLFLLRPRVVVYNLSIDRLRPILAELAPRLDGDARWAGDSVALPHLGVQFFLDNVVSLKNISVVGLGPKQNADGWRRFEAALRQDLGHIAVRPNWRAGANQAFLGGLLVGLVVVSIARDPESVYRALFEMFRL